MLIGMNQFVNGGSDEGLLKSLAADPNYADSEELAKALKKEGLVQVQTTVNGKHGTYTRMQWKRASDVKSGDKVVGQRPSGLPGHTPDKPKVGKMTGQISNVKVDKSTSPATVHFHCGGKSYAAAEGKNVTIHIMNAKGEKTKIRGQLKVGNGYPRIGAYPLEGLDNVISLSTQETNPVPAEDKGENTPKLPDGITAGKDGKLSWDESKMDETDVLDSLCGEDTFWDAKEDIYDKVMPQIAKENPGFHDDGGGEFKINSIKLSGDSVEVTGTLTLEGRNDHYDENEIHTKTATTKIPLKKSK
ncbi:MAG: hypothetical protein NC548_20125 [Lachnospiraceae bacterium]|nr:hypothetical protein [Lachnospiraceae bacterium]